MLLIDSRPAGEAAGPLPASVATPERMLTQRVLGAYWNRIEDGPGRFFVPGHHLPEPLRERALVEPEAHSSLLDASTAFAARVVKRYRDRRAVVAWQVEHDAVDPGWA